MGWIDEGRARGERVMSRPEKDFLRDLYQRRAGTYDITANLYYLMGFRSRAYRKGAVRSLSLERGDTVVDIACGTGLNFAHLQRAVGPEGRIIGVDLTEAMLEKARRRVERRGWGNVELVQSDAAAYAFPEGVGGVLSSFALTLVPEYDQVIQRGARALRRGGRLAVLDFKMPEGPAARLAPALITLTRPFGVREQLAARHPWESVERHLGNLHMEEFYLGFCYMAMGEKRTGSQGKRPWKASLMRALRMPRWQWSSSGQ